MNLKKCGLFHEKVKCLKHVVRREGIAADPTKTKAVCV